MTKLLEKINAFREEEMRKLNVLKYPYGNVTTINLTMLKGTSASDFDRDLKCKMFNGDVLIFF